MQGFSGAESVFGGSASEFESWGYNLIQGLDSGVQRFKFLRFSNGFELRTKSFVLDEVLRELCGSTIFNANISFSF